jgi:hypothetical protein
VENLLRISLLTYLLLLIHITIVPHVYLLGSDGFVHKTVAEIGFASGFIDGHSGIDVAPLSRFLQPKQTSTGRI